MKPYPFSENMTFFLIFSTTIKDIGNISALFDRPNKTLQLSL